MKPKSLAAILVLFGFFGIAHGAIPQLLDFQGILRDADGNPLTASQDIAFGFHDATTDGTLLLEDIHLGVAVENGLFVVKLGGGVITGHVYGSLGELFGNESDVYLSLTVGTDPPMTPRIHIVSSGFALNSDMLDGKHVDAFISTSAPEQTIDGRLTVQGDLDIVGGLVGTGGRDSGGEEWTFEAGYFANAGAWVELAAEGQAEGGPTMGIQASGSLFAGNFLGRLRAEGHILAEDGVQFADGSHQSTSATNAMCEQLTGSAPCDLVAAIQNASLPTNSVRVVADAGVGADAWVSVAIGADGNPVVSYYDQVDADLRVAHCFDRSCSSAETNTVDSVGDVGRYNALVISGGLPVISYYDATNGDLKVASCVDAGCNVSNTSTKESTDDVGRYTSIAIGGVGTPIISYYDATNGELRFAQCFDAQCETTMAFRTVATSGDSGRYTSIAYDGTRPVISYIGEDDYVKLALCQDASCSSPALLVTITDYINNSYQTAVILGSDGFPTVVWGYNQGVEGTPFAVHVAHCLDATCTSLATGGLDFAGSARPEPGVSMMPGVDGNPVVSWRRADGLHVVHCQDASCSAEPDVLLLESGNALGDITSIAPATDGKPVVAYSGTGGTLRVATNVTFSTNGSSAPTATVADIDVATSRAAAGRSAVQARRGSAVSTLAGAPVYRDGNVYATSFRPSATELANVVEVVPPAEPGDVLVIDAERPGLMSLARVAGDSSVFGVVTEAPGVVLGSPPPGGAVATTRTVESMGAVSQSGAAQISLPVVLSGIVMCKVDAGYGEIRPGDLLTTSPTPGHAMRSLEPRPGTILGKALEPLAAGTGRIRILVTLR